MTPPVPVNHRRRFIKKMLLVAAVVLFLVLGVRLWFYHNARSALKSYIAEQSGGKIRLELKGLDLDLWDKSLLINHADLRSTDSLREPITYHVRFRSLSLKVASVWALLFQKKLLIDSLKLYDPVLKVMQWRRDTSKLIVRDELSIPQEMGKMYNSLQDALNEFGVRRIVIANASISLVNKMKPGSETVTVSRIYFDLARTPVKHGKTITYHNKEQTIDLRTTRQDIAMPGGRHRLSFKSFHLQLYRQSVELDSCTITAVATDSTKSNFRIFFKKLLLTGVDFAALSTQNLVKADTVLCEQPYFDFDIYRSETVAKKAGPPDPGKIIGALSGNLELAWVGVKNAGINFNIYGETKRSIANSNKDNFEMEDLRINPDSAEPVSIKRFDMTLRDYDLYNEDSSSIFSFDSLQFANKEVVLHNFGMNSRSGRKLRNDIDITVPYFQLTGLDWYRLIFDQKMAATDAMLNSPTINFTRRKPAVVNKTRRFDLFDALLSVDSLVALDNVSVINGQVNMVLGPATSFKVQDLNFRIQSNRLLQSTTKEQLRSAVDHLSFTNGVLRLKDITARLQHARFTNNNRVYAERIIVSGQGDKISGSVNKVYINNMQLDDAAAQIEVDGVGWESASVALKTLPPENGNNKHSSIINLRNINGRNTQLTLATGAISIATFVDILSAASVFKKGNELVRVEGFNLAGNNLIVNSKTAIITADSYNITGTDASSLSGVQVRQINGNDTLSIRSAQVGFSTDLNELFTNNLVLDYVHATAPVISIVKRDTVHAANGKAGQMLPVKITSLTATEPSIYIASHRNDSVAIVNIPKSENSMVKAANIIISGGDMQIGSLQVNTTAATYTNTAGEVVGIEKGKIDLDLADLQFGKRDGKMNWSGTINNMNLQNAAGLQMGKGKTNLRFRQASLGNLKLSAASLPDFGELMRQNLTAWLHIPQGQYIDSNTSITWYNANYNNNTRTLSLDSFVYHPTKPLDSAVASRSHQFDYITLRTGAIAISDLDLEQYEKDSSFFAGNITVRHPVLTVYRDKQPPPSPFKKPKPLPVNLLKNIPFPLSVQKLVLDSGMITYTERNGKSRMQGDLVLANVNATLSNIKNRQLAEEDSLVFTFNASLMNAADLRLTLKESYTDSLGGFLVKATVSPVDLTLANAFTVPLVNVKFSSGVLDSVSFSAVGRQDLAAGTMEMRYKDLRIKLVKDGDPGRSTFLQNTLSFIANTFLIRRNNTDRTGLIYFKHLPNQSFVNYIVKLTMSGVATSVGVKKNRKYRKQYLEQLKKTGAPAVKGF